MYEFEKQYANYDADAKLKPYVEFKPITAGQVFSICPAFPSGRRFVIMSVNGFDLAGR